MKRSIYILVFLGLAISLQAQERSLTDTIDLEEVVVTANRTAIRIKNNPGAVSYVSRKELKVMPKSIGAEEALRLVPGVRIDNQHDGERVHISIRGQGILTERGLRGIGIMLDGIPLNDPSGFAPDLYDVDWATVHSIEVLRGPAAGLYGSGGAAGIISITTDNGGSKPIGGTFSQHAGSHGFFKTRVGLNGSKETVNYRLEYARTSGNGYRVHQAFWANNLYEKLHFAPSEKLSLTQILSHTDYFQQNPEGLNLSQLDDPRQANPDAIPFNEYQKTNRTTWGITGTYNINDKQNIKGYAFYRTWRYKETSNKYAAYSDHTDPGLGVQYNFHFHTGRVIHHFGVGTDLKWQTIKVYKLKSAADPGRVESIDETNLETDTLLANQIIDQNSTGLYALYRFEAGRFNIIGNIRYDDINNALTDKMVGPDSARTAMDFSDLSSRLGVSYNFSDAVTLFANFSQGILPPSTEELAANPEGYSGFNTHLVPATSNCFEVGGRGKIGKRIFYDVTGFLMYTRNDFFRFKQSGRGNQEVFYGNAGNSRRYGVETYFSAGILKNLDLQVAYTFSDFRYTSAEIDPVYTDTNYVLTTPPEAGQYLPNSPKHQLYAQIQYRPIRNIEITLGTEVQSKWAIYTDAKAYHGELDPAVFQNWQKGFNLYHAKVSYLWKLKAVSGVLSFSARNFTGTRYMAFTEPDPDGNAYHPGPRQEFFGSVTVRF